LRGGLDRFQNLLRHDASGLLAATDVKKKIEAAFQRQAHFDAKDIDLRLRR
jgi:hypothetical protein